MSIETKAVKFYLVTGGAGFIGSNIALALSQAGHRVVICDDLGQDQRWMNLREATLHDIVSIAGLPDWLQRNVDVLDGIVHMGAISSTLETDIDNIVQLNIRSTLDLWSLCARHDIPLVYASSAATYGDGAQGFVDDGSSEALSRLRPLNAYGWSKHFVDRRIAYDVEAGAPSPRVWAGLKFFNVYGPREGHKGAMRSVVHQFWPRARAGETVSLFKSENEKFPDGGQMRDFVYVEDCVRVALNILLKQEFSGIYNVGSGQARSFQDLTEATFLAVGKSPKIDYKEMPTSMRGRYQYFTQADTGRLVDAGVAPNFHSLEDGVADYVNWLERTPDA